MSSLRITLPFNGHVNEWFYVLVDLSLVHQLSKPGCDDCRVQCEHIELVAEKRIIRISQVNLDLRVRCQRFIVGIEIPIENPIEAVGNRSTRILGSPIPPFIVSVAALVAPKRCTLVNAVPEQWLTHQFACARMGGLRFVEWVVFSHMIQWQNVADHPVGARDLPFSRRPTRRLGCIGWFK
ncbi:hypothetical protein-transmembrane prediction [Rhodopirellula baltica SH 1]|uniref:Uncharacterized protein n=1 Tax=Rhodopirellula baltica (strain DSM 10527 / NCIMB 13988 / SH1) TaxID=243090 RepID=Q7UUQ7_RHOBA|nr:hypothetical protein-transmembrane prediction [Rhodopirellula baltica SH 1]